MKSFHATLNELLENWIPKLANHRRVALLRYIVEIRIAEVIVRSSEYAGDGDISNCAPLHYCLRMVILV